MKKSVETFADKSQKNGIVNSSRSRKSIVAIVGRPNVGKSTLFNRICRKRSAIVDFEEGVTRDRKYEDAEWTGKNFIIVDTGGIIPKSNDRMDMAVKFQAEVAILEADFILFIVDAKTGTTDIDLEIARILSPHREKVMLVANKVDNEKDELEVYDFMQLGFGEAFPIAAIQGRNTGNFLDELVSHIDTVPATDEEDDSIKVAIVGKPNVGKSSVVNRLSGQDINIVTDIPGTTRDSIDTHFKHFGKKITFIDTAGLRRKKNIKYGVEYFSTMRTIESINRADVVLLVMDATEELSNQDQKIVSYAARNYKDIIIVINKWDLVDKNNSTVGEFVKDIRQQLKFVEFAPVVFISALTGQRVQKVFDMILQVSEESKKRIGTSELNRFLQRVIAKFPPSHSSGKHTKIFYCTQVKGHPPTFVFFCNNSKLITTHYKRYLQNQLRDTFKFEGASIKTLFRSREENDLF
ncbi:MAG: ribosome biogenesis GTPase Der [Candidatus Cloacimonadota bacterium]|nr:MAG: ribosome biogenesis GTPase Der [Candidatus Cloacimonadota bacterium]